MKNLDHYHYAHAQRDAPSKEAPYHLNYQLSKDPRHPPNYPFLQYDFPKQFSHSYTNSILLRIFLLFYNNPSNLKNRIEPSTISTEGWTVSKGCQHLLIVPRMESKPSRIRDNDASCTEGEGERRRRSRRMYACTNGTRH